MVTVSLVFSACAGDAGPAKQELNRDRDEVLGLLLCGSSIVTLPNNALPGDADYIEFRYKNVKVIEQELGGQMVTRRLSPESTRKKLKACASSEGCSPLKADCCTAEQELCFGSK